MRAAMILSALQQRTNNSLPFFILDGYVFLFYYNHF